MTAALEDIDIFDRAVQRSREWLEDVCDALETDDTRYAYRLLKAYLHVVRDSLPLEDAARVSAQLPHLLRGVFYDGWDGRAEAPYEETAMPLVARLADAAKLDSLEEAARAAAALSHVFARRLGRPPLLAEDEDAVAHEPIGALP
jgi:uncharacterized protein (DUF2267 family)